MIGPGKYDDIAMFAMSATQAEAVVVLILNGNHGSGMSVAMIDPSYLHTLPAALRQVANDVEADARSMEPTQ